MIMLKNVYIRNGNDKEYESRLQVMPFVVREKELENKVGDEKHAYPKLSLKEHRLV
jgi:hypothetical protein